MSPPIPGLFITATDTDAGKTRVAATIARSLRTTPSPPRIGVYKPVASGVTTAGSGDAGVLWEAAGEPLTIEAVCPQRFTTPLAPHHAARIEGSSVDEDLLRAGLEPWLAASDIVLIEGAGGLFSPVSERLLNADLAKDFAYPAVIVDAGRLGCIGRVLATVTAARAYGVAIAAVALSQVDADDASPAPGPSAPARILADGAEELRGRLPGVPVVVLPHGSRRFVPPIDWMTLGRRQG